MNVGNSSVRAIILSGGEGRRISPLTDRLRNIRAVPKSLMPLANIPAINRLITGLTTERIADSISIGTAFMSEKVRAVVGNGSGLGVRIKCFDDVEREKRGDMQAFFDIAADKIRQGFDGTFVAMASDLLTDISVADVLRFHFEKTRSAHPSGGMTMVVNPVPRSEVYRFGTILVDGNDRVVNFWEKNPDSPSNLNNSSIYAIDAALLRTIMPFMDGKYMFPHLLQWLVESNSDKEVYPFFAYNHSGYWRDFGKLDSYWDAQWDILDGMIRSRHSGFFIEKDYRTNINGVQFIGPVIVGTDCQFGQGSTIGPYVTLGDNVVVGRGVELRGTVVLGSKALWPKLHTKIPRGTHIENCVLLSETSGNKNLNGVVVVDLEEGQEICNLGLLEEEMSRVRYIDINKLSVEGLPSTVSTEYWGQRRVWDRWDVERSEGKNIPVHTRQREMTVSAIRQYVPENSVVVDACCGTGKISYDILGLDNVSQLISFDINGTAAETTKNALKSHSRSERSTVLNGNVYDVLSGLSDVGCVVCLDALHHLPDIKLALTSIHDSLAAGGIFIGNFLAAENVNKHVGEKRGTLNHYYLNYRAEVLRRLKFIPGLWSFIGRKGYVRMILLKQQQVKDLLESLFTIKEFKTDDYHWFVAQKK